MICSLQPTTTLAEAALPLLLNLIRAKFETRGHKTHMVSPNQLMIRARWRLQYTLVGYVFPQKKLLSIYRDLIANCEV